MAVAQKNEVKNVEEKIKNLMVFTTNRSWARMVKSLFPVHKIETHVCFNRQNAISILQDNKLDIILTDDSFKSEEINSFAKQVKRFQKSTNYFIYTSDITLIDTLKKNVSNLEINTFLAPVNPGEVQRTIISRLYPRTKKQVMYNVDLNLMKTFITSTNEVMQEMVGIEEMTNFSPFILGSAGKTVEQISIRGKLAIDCQYFKGTFFICFPEETFLNIYEKMMGEREDVINDEIRDMGAEFANIIYGKAKRVLNNENYDLGMVIPGVDLQKSIKSKFDVIVIPMYTEIGVFYIKIAPNYIKND